MNFTPITASLFLPPVAWVKWQRERGKRLAEATTDKLRAFASLLCCVCEKPVQPGQHYIQTQCTNVTCAAVHLLHVECAQR